jgi:hypothetical protein
MTATFRIALSLVCFMSAFYFVGETPPRFVNKAELSGTTCLSDNSFVEIVKAHLLSNVRKRRLKLTFVERAKLFV